MTVLTTGSRVRDPIEAFFGEKTAARGGTSVGCGRGGTSAHPTPSQRAAAKAAKAVKTLAVDLASLADLDAVDLRHRWHDAFGIEPLARLSREVIIAALSYQIQAEAEGGLSKKAGRRLEKLGLELATKGTVSVEVDVGIRSGTRLVREWNGTVHEVVVLENGYLWKGKSYASLSEIARLITGARWSGPRFFGTKTQARGWTASGAAAPVDRRAGRVGATATAVRS